MSKLPAMAGHTVVVRDHSYRSDASLLHSMREVLRPSYEGEPAMLAHDLERCDRAYLLQDGATLLAFFLAGFTKLAEARALAPAIYLGLSAVDERHKNTGLARAVFDRFTVDARALQSAVGGEVTMFGTLATPSSFHVVHSLWRHAQPAGDGTYPDSAVSDAERCAKWLEATASPHHPFVLPGYAEGTRYSASERARISSLCARKGFVLFERLGVDERRGDRILVTCRP